MWSIHFHSLSSILNSLHSSTNQEVFEKHLCIKSSHYEKYGQLRISLHKGSHHVLPPNWHFSLSAKINGTQRRTLVSPWRMTLYILQYAKRRLSGWSNVEQWKIKLIALAVIKLRLSEGISQLANRKFCVFLKFRSNFLKAFQVDLKACLGLILPNQYCPIKWRLVFGWFCFVDHA